MERSRILAAVAVAAVVVASWVGFADRQAVRKADPDGVERRAEACGPDRARASGLGGYLPNDDSSPAPETAFVDADGAPVTLADFRGTALVVNFWATWCAPCVEEMPALDRLDSELRQNGGRVIAISEDREAANVSPAFYEEHGLTSLDMYADRQMKLARAARVSGLPTTLLIGRDGMEIGSVLGAAKWDDPDIVAFVKTCLDADAG